MKTLYRYGLFVLLLCIPLFLLSSAGADVHISFSPDAPRLGDYVDIQVTGDREEIPSVRYDLSMSEEIISEGKPTDHFSASFRPRKEGVYTLTVTLIYGKKDEESAAVSIPVSGVAPAQEGPEVIYSQRDGWWADKVYNKKHHRSLQKAGCAIFTLSHALQRMGIPPAEAQPETLAAKYSRFYVEERGTDNGSLIRQAAEDFDFITQTEEVTGAKQIAACLRRGDQLSVGHVLGHIALLNGISEDGKYVHVVDSAVSATFERLASRKANIGHVFFRDADGSFTEALTADQLPGIRWFLETGEYGGAEYWMELSYIGKKNMRLIRPQWLLADLGSGTQGVSVEYAGALMTKVTRDEEAMRMPTNELHLSAGATPQVALVTAKKGARPLDGGNTIRHGAMMLVLNVLEDSVYVFRDDSFLLLDAKDVTLLPAETGTFQTGLISVNGKTTGSVQITVHRNPKGNSDDITKWKPGTPVAVVERDGEFLLMEGKGYRGWVHEKYFTPDDTASGE